MVMRFTKIINHQKYNIDAIPALSESEPDKCTPGIIGSFYRTFKKDC